MLYSLIPPIIIILSLAGIILFLAKKAPQVAKFSEDSLKSGENIDNKSSSNAKKIIKEKSLLILEKLTRRLKLYLLRLENIFTGWSEIIKRKRNGKASEEKTGQTFRRIYDELPREKVSRPILSEKIVIPKTRSEKKNIFENIMIERIASNPKDVEAYERLGEYYMDLGNWDDSKECFKQVIKLDSKNENAKGKLKNLEKMLG